MCFLLGVTLNAASRDAAARRFAAASSGPLKWLSAPIEMDMSEAAVGEQSPPDPGAERGARERSPPAPGTEGAAGERSPRVSGAEEDTLHDRMENPVGDEDGRSMLDWARHPLFVDLSADEGATCPECGLFAPSSVCDTCGCPVLLFPLADLIFCEGAHALVSETYRRAYQPFYAELVGAVLYTLRLLDKGASTTSRPRWTACSSLRASSAPTLSCRRQEAPSDLTLIKHF